MSIGGNILLMYMIIFTGIGVFAVVYFTCSHVMKWIVSLLMSAFLNVLHKITAPNHSL